jgi:hypothetical protein
MKLSDAIRLGAMMKPQAYEESGEQGSCVLRAAADAVGIRDQCRDAVRYLDYAALGHRFPELLLCSWRCPACKRVTPDNLMHLLYHLNDDHQWTRERIADWVASVEPRVALDPVLVETPA